jgi:hypothetical protein
MATKLSFELISDLSAVASGDCRGSVAIPVVLSLCYILGYNWGDYASVAQW